MAENQNRRESFRLDDMLHIADFPLTRGELELKKNQTSNLARQSLALRDAIGSSSSINFGGVQGTDANTLKGLDILDAKLNYIISMLSDQKAFEAQLEKKQVNISATGIKFVTRHDYCKDDFVELRLMLPLFPPLFLDLLGKVKQASASKLGHLMIGVEFLFKSDVEERTLSQYVFQRHREILRSERHLGSKLT